jgi:hypothetical protein
MTKPGRGASPLGLETLTPQPPQNIFAKMKADIAVIVLTQTLACDGTTYIFR